jgi:hypothetical protein
MTLKAYACALAALVALRLIYNAILIAAIGISPVPWRSFFFVALIAIVIGSCAWPFGSCLDYPNGRAS